MPHYLGLRAGELGVGRAGCSSDGSKDRWSAATARARDGRGLSLSVDDREAEEEEAHVEDSVRWRDVRVGEVLEAPFHPTERAGGEGVLEAEAAFRHEVEVGAAVGEPMGGKGEAGPSHEVGGPASAGAEVILEQ